MRKPLRVVFLDFDGVLNDEDWNASARKQPLDAIQQEFPNYLGGMLEDLQFLDPSKVARLSGLVERADASIVLSTSWAWKEPVPYLASILYDRGLRSPERVIGAVVTEGIDADTYHRTTRAEAVLAWLKRVPVKQWVAIDDEDMTRALGERFIRTDMYGGGLTDEHVSRALKLLGVDDDAR